MSRIIDEELFKSYLQKYSEGKLDVSNPSVNRFLKTFAGSIMMLIPEATAILVDNGMAEDPKSVYAAMAAYGATLKDFAEAKLEIMKGEKNEKFNSIVDSLSIRKLWH